jgi:glycosyltransferase involved in cell wall biosynthesis
MSRVSIIVPVYNNRAQLRQAVVSLVEQAIPGLEVVVVDDGSTDGSADTVRDLPVRIVSQENRGHPAARNAGLAEARGELIGFLDSDDLAAPHGLARLARRLDAEPDWPVAGGMPAGVIDDDGRVLTSFGPHSAGAPSALRLLDLELYRAGRFFPVNVWLYLFRRSFFETMGGFDTTIRFSDDADVILRALRKQAIPILDLPLVYRRVHTSNLSLERSGDGLQLKAECIEELKMIYERHGVRPEVWNWKPFELGFDLPPEAKT